jgi:hypothetical protein
MAVTLTPLHITGAVAKQGEDVSGIFVSFVSGSSAGMLVIYALPPPA